MTIEIVDFPMKNGGSFQFAMLVYQRVIPVHRIVGRFTPAFSPFVSGKKTFVPRIWGRWVKWRLTSFWSVDEWLSG
jgi:hypothetical protein